MKHLKLMTIISCFLIAAGVLLFCLPAVLSMPLYMYKYYIFSGAVTLSMAIIIPEVIKGCRALLKG